MDGRAEDDLEMSLPYRLITRLEATGTRLRVCWLHLFNRRIHRRAQMHDQLRQRGVVPPPLVPILYLRRTENPH
jgi:uncharacterized damage-inducible protein DinB